MWIVAVIAVTAILAAMVALLARRSAGPSAVMFQEIRNTVLALQRVAAARVIPGAVGEDGAGLSVDDLRNHSACVRETIRFVYTVEETEGGFLHTVSSQMLAPKPEDYQVQCMLVAMLTLNQQLSEAGLDPDDVGFEVSASEHGTHYLAMLLTAGQHETIVGESAAYA